MGRIALGDRTVLDLAGLAEIMEWRNRDVAASNYRRSERRRRQGIDTARDVPAADARVGREPVWYEETILNWIPTRPGQGSGGGRPSHQTTKPDE